MEVYIQGENSLIPIQEEVTAQSIENALGYVPADAEDIIECIEESDDTALYVTDKDGNIITKTDGEGFHASAMTVNGKDVESGLVTDEDRASWGGSDLDDVISKDDDSTLYVTDKDGNIITKIDKDGLHTTEVYIGNKTVADMLADLVGAAPETLDTLEELATAFKEHEEVAAALDEAITNKANATDFETHKADYESHKTDYASHKSDYATHKADFESHKGDSTHLGDEIKLDDDENLYICDKDGNIIARFDGDGLDVTDLKIMGVPLSLNGLDKEQATLLENLSKWYDEEHYVDISITSFTNSLAGSYEKGDIVIGAATLAWAFNRTPTALTLNGTSKSVSSTGETVASATYSSNTTWTLKATGENGETITRTTGIYFYNAIFYGVSSSTPDDTELFANLTKSLQNSHKTSLSVTAGEGEYIYYCVPASFSVPTFTIGGFVGGLTKVATVSYSYATNTEDYYIYRSDYANLGDTTVYIN